MVEGNEEKKPMQNAEFDGEVNERQKSESVEVSQAPEVYKQERLTHIDRDLSVLEQNVGSVSAETVQLQRQEAFDAKKSGLEQGLDIRLTNETTDQIREHMVDEVVDRDKKDRERVQNLQRLQRAAEMLSSNDFRTLEEVLGNREGRIDQLFDPQGKAMHTTNSESFEKILASGTLRTGTGGDGIQRTQGASFVDGDFSEVATFQGLYDDINSKGSQKALNSEKYGAKAEGFVSYFWKQDEKGAREYFSRLGKQEGKPVETLDDALALAGEIKKRIAPLPEGGAMHGVTIVYDKKVLPELSKDRLVGLQKQFELRSERPGGVPLAEASAVLVPRANIEETRRKLAEQGLGHIDVRPSEDMEARRILSIAETRTNE